MDGFFYSRLGNPTVEAVEKKICALEGGVGCILTASGQAASFLSVLNICSAGDHIVSSATIYGGTFNLFDVTLRRLGIETTFVDADAPLEELQKAIRPNTKVVFGESIANPVLKVLDIEKMAALAHSNGLPLIVDNTFPTPVNCRPFEWGADIVIHSTTKYMDGHAQVVGGAVVDSGRFDWTNGKFPGLVEPDESYHGLSYTQHFGKAAYIAKARAQLIRDLGIGMTPNTAYILNLGLETCPCAWPSTARTLKRSPSTLKTTARSAGSTTPAFPPTNTMNAAKKYMPNGTCGVISFGVKGGRRSRR